MKPSELFDVSGRSALVTGASGAFGAVAARTLAGAGCRLTLAAGNADALEAVAGECRALGASVAAVNARPDSEAAADAMVEKTVETHGRLDILVVASGINRAGDDRGDDACCVRRSHGRQRDADLAAGARRDAADEGAGRRRQDSPRLLDARAARPSRRLYRLLRFEGGGRRHHQSAGLRTGPDGNHRQRDWADRLPLAPGRVDVH